ncbi:MAG: bacillithiol biosynthesis BshC, partial [Flavobacteriales bacterium]|nr:bacillithiol biosynthesis BshC [Flavobacteriales bacterium]
EMDSHPERFSPNVLTRPLYEEKILPNLAYIGGPGESAYWMQLKSIFEYHNINYPMVILRDSIQWVDLVSQQKLMKIGIDIQEIFQSIDKLEQLYIKTNATSFLSDKYLKQLNVLFDGLSEDISKVDQSLLRTLKGEKVRSEQGLENVIGKTNKAIKRKHEVELNQLRKLKEKLFPNDGLQERYDNIIPLYSRYGKDLIQLLIDNVNVLNKKFTVLLED